MAMIANMSKVKHLSFNSIEHCRKFIMFARCCLGLKAWLIGWWWNQLRMTLPGAHFKASPRFGWATVKYSPLSQIIYGISNLSILHESFKQCNLHLAVFARLCWVSHWSLIHGWIPSLGTGSTTSTQVGSWGHSSTDEKPFWCGAWWFWSLSVGNPRCFF